tara:strand:- start:180 stop:695 length:516 start_codon:yes stop_codon:yes gene_type:complete
MGYTSYLEKYEIIRVTPTLDTSAYSNNDVFFNATEIPNAVRESGGCSRLLDITILNEDNVDCAVDLVFMQVSKDLGTINDVVGSNSKWTNALAKAAKVLGVVKIDMTDSFTNLVNNIVYTYNNFGTGSGGMAPFLLQAESDSTSVYVAAVIRDGTPTCAADDWELVFHIEK